jgi:hypothetical protein
MKNKLNATHKTSKQFEFNSATLLNTKWMRLYYMQQLTAPVTTKTAAQHQHNNRIKIIVAQLK